MTDMTVYFSVHTLTLVTVFVVMVSVSCIKCVCLLRNIFLILITIGVYFWFVVQATIDMPKEISPFPQSIPVGLHFSSKRRDHWVFSYGSIFFLINCRWFKFVIKCLWVAFFFHFEKSVFCFIKSPLWSNNKFSQPLYEYTNSHAAIPCSYFTHFQASRRHTIWVFSW